MSFMNKQRDGISGPGKTIVPVAPASISWPAPVKWTGRAPLHTTLGGSWTGTGLRTLCLACSGMVLLYSVMVLMQVAWMGTIGVRCLFGTDVKEEISADYQWTPIPVVEAGVDRVVAGDTVDRPEIGDKLLSLGGIGLHEGSYSDYIQALRRLADQVGRTVEVTWRDSRSQQVHAVQALVRYPPTRSYVWSFVWFLQELLIFGVEHAFSGKGPTIFPRGFFTCSAS